MTTTHPTDSDARTPRPNVLYDLENLADLIDGADGLVDKFVPYDRDRRALEQEGAIAAATAYALIAIARELHDLTDLALERETRRLRAELAQEPAPPQVSATPTLPDIAAGSPRGDWGPWTLDREALALVLDDEGYGVDLERCRTSAEVLDSIAQVGGKAWASDAIVAGLVRALVDVLHPQRTLCSLGSPKTLTTAALRTLVDAVR